MEQAQPMSEVLKRAPASDLHKMLIAMMVQHMALQDAQNKDDDKERLAEPRAQLEAQIQMVSEEIDRRSPLERRGRIVTA